MVTDGGVGPLCTVAQVIHPTEVNETWMELSPQIYEPSVNI